MKKWLFVIAVFVLVYTCASSLSYAQSSYGSGSNSNTNSNSSGLSSFMRNTSQSGGMSKYLANDRTSTSIQNQPPRRVMEITEVGSDTVTSPRTSSPLSNKTQAGTSSQNQTYQSGLPQTSGLSGSTSYMRQFNTTPAQTPNMMSDYTLANNTQSQVSSDELARKLDEITKQLNSLQQKMESGNYNQSPAPSVTTNRFINTASPLNVSSSSDMRSGYEPAPSTSYPRANTNMNPYPSGIDSSSSSMGMQEYDLSRYANSRPQQSSNDSLDEIKATLDELSRSIGTHMQSNTAAGNMNQQSYARGGGQDNSRYRQYTQSKFDNYYNTGHEQLLAGNYFDAADSFTLACVYEPENPYCYAGQAHALFAAGQFVTSALHIIRAIELNPEYIQTNVDLFSVIGNRDVVMSRTSELEQILRKNPASGLQILLSYIYYRTGKLAEARQIINAAYQESQNSRAALSLKMAIDTKINYSR